MSRAVAFDLQSIVDAVFQAAEPPGIVCAVLHDGRRHRAAAGFANVAERIEMTADSVFHLGSVTKVLTASLVMELVSQARVDLDDPVIRHLPEFPFPEAITVRMLLAHTSGIDAGDYITDFGRNEDCLERYVASLKGFGQLHDPGAHHSYCNAGYVALGRLLEVVHGTPFDTVFAEGLDRFGMERCSTQPEEAILRRVCVGHYPYPGGAPTNGSAASGERGSAPRLSGRWKRTQTWMLPRAMGPAGSTVTATVDDLLTFAETQMQPNPMHDEQIAYPIPLGMSHGLGWMRAQLGDVIALMHTGGSYGGEAGLFLVPSEGFALATFVNCIGGDAVARQLRQTTLRGLIGERAAAMELPAWVPEPDASALTRYEGVYRRHWFTTKVKAGAQSLQLRTEIGGGLEAFIGATTNVQELELVPRGRGCFGPAAAPDQSPVIAFIGEGKPELLFARGRLLRRLDA